MGEKSARHVAVSIIYDKSISKVLMITSRKHPHLWILPKGGVEKGESSGEAAVRESWEEAGSPKDLIAPTDGDRLMMLTLEPGTSKRPSVWHIHVIRTTEAAVDKVADWPERLERQRSWYTLQDALGKIGQWYTDPKASTEASNDTEILDDKQKKHSKKKAMKGGAMETAFRAFMESEGVTP